MKRPEISPEMFITKPYSLCSNCGTNNLWVLVMGRSRWYCEQRCRKCFHKTGFDLPEIKKKIIYLDQFAISKMMKAINENHPSNSKDELIIWREIFNKIDTLLHFQLIICPYSALHEDESILANKNYTHDYQSLKSMYKHLAQWKHFPHTEEIERVQYFNGFKKYLWDKIDLPDWEATNWDDFHEWSDNVYISVESWYLERIMDDIHTDKNNMHEAIIGVYDNEWSKVQKSYQELYNLEMRANGKSLYDNYFRNIKSGNLWKENDRFLLFYDLLARIWINEKVDQWKIIATFLFTSDLSNIPFVNIESILWAWIAELAYKKNISRKQINAWMVNDISALSHYFQTLGYKNPVTLVRL